MIEVLVVSAEQCASVSYSTVVDDKIGQRPFIYRRIGSRGLDAGNWNPSSQAFPGVVVAEPNEPDCTP